MLATGIITPFRVAFVDSDATSWNVIDYMFDGLFAFDILMNFISAYHDKNNRLVVDMKKIAKNYLLGWFIIDACSM